MKELLMTLVLFLVCVLFAWRKDVKRKKRRNAWRNNMATRTNPPAPKQNEVKPSPAKTRSTTPHVQ